MKTSDALRIVGHSVSEDALYCFGDFVLDPRRRTVSRGDSPVLLTPKAFDLLMFFVQNPNRLVTKEELLQGVWGDSFVEEGNLTRYVSHLRKALNDDEDDTRLIVTIARKGYQFTARVIVTGGEENENQTKLHVVPSDGVKPGPDLIELPTRDTVPALTRPHFHLRKWIPAAVLLLAIIAAFWSYRSSHPQVTLSATDTIVLADVTNRTSDPAFDDALNTALRYATEQTPYLNILGIDKVFGTLAELRFPPNSKLMPEVAREVCLRTNSRLLITTSIADAGNGYRIDINAADCQSGKSVARIQEEVADRNQVVYTLGVAVARLRRKLGEPTASLARFNKPLDEALSPSIEALQVGTMGYKRHLAGDFQGAISYYKRALELDPNLAPTYEGLGAAYYALDEEGLTAPAITKAYQLRARMTEVSRLETEYLYYAWVTRDLDKALSIVMQSVQTFPRNVPARLNLSSCLAFLGQPDKAAAEDREVARLQPTAYNLQAWAVTSLHAGRLKEAQAAFDEAAALKLDSAPLRDVRIRLALVQQDEHVMAELLNGVTDKPGDYELLLTKAEIEEYYGHFRRAGELIEQAFRTAPVALAEGRHQVSLLQSGPRYALWEAESGDSARARRMAKTALETVNGRDEEQYLALAFARAGDIEQARKLADALDQLSPHDTLIQNYGLPTIRAAMKLDANDPAGAIAVLQPARRYELTWNPSFNGPYPAYIRGLAYLQLGQGRLAATEFQKLMDHRGLVGTDMIGALAYLQMARAQQMMGDKASASKSYEEFLDLWKDADADIPILKEAKTEYASLRNSNP